MRYLLLFTIFIFLLGTSVCALSARTQIENHITKDKISDTTSDKNIEGLETNNICGTALIKRGGRLLLFIDPNNKDELPIEFDTLDDYINYLDENKLKGIECPVLFLQQENDAQGNDVYRVRPSPFNQAGGMDPINVVPIQDASRANYPYNSNQYPGIDTTGSQIGVYNELDEIHDSTSKALISDNPMDTNWGGVEFTNSKIEGGKYEDNEVNKPLYFNPKTQFLPDTFNRENPKSYIPSTGPK
jgi:hypothetical protein